MQGSDLKKYPDTIRVGYENFYTLDQTAGLVFAFVSHSQEAVDRIFKTSVSDLIYNITDPALSKGEIRSFRNLIQGQVYPSGYTYDGYKRSYGFKTVNGFGGENKGEGQHYHFFALMGYIPAAEAASHNGFDTWAYQGERLKRGFTTGAPWAHTAYRSTDPGDRNHAPLYWMVQRRFPTDAAIKSVTDKSASEGAYSYFVSHVAPLWRLAGSD